MTAVGSFAPVRAFRPPKAEPADTSHLCHSTKSLRSSPLRGGRSQQVESPVLRIEVSSTSLRMELSMSETNTVSPLRQRMIEDMAARKLNPHTQRSHISSCKRFAAWLKRSPNTATPDEVRRFQPLQPHLQILRRSRRPLLCGLEQARRSALAHHVHRTAPMGARVLIIGIWYYTAYIASYWTSSFMKRSPRRQYRFFADTKQFTRMVSFSRLDRAD